MTIRRHLLITLFGVVANLESHGQPVHALMGVAINPEAAGAALFQDYSCIGINPANLGIYAYQSEVPIVNLSILTSTGTFFSDALPKSMILPSLFGRHVLTSEEKRTAALSFVESGHTVSAQLMPVALAVQFPRFAGIAFTWRERIVGSVHLTTPLADLLFNGLHSPYIDTVVELVTGDLLGFPTQQSDLLQLFAGSHLQYNWLREYAISVGRRIIEGKFLQLYAGATYKILQSNALVQMHFSADTISGIAAFSPLFNINYDRLLDPDVQVGGRFAPVGTGMAIDAGITCKLGRSLYLAASLTDLGTLTYRVNTVGVGNILNDTLINYLGLNYATVFSDWKNLFNASGLFSYVPAGEQQVALPTAWRLAAGWYLSDEVHLGADVRHALNDQWFGLDSWRLGGMLTMSVVPNLIVAAGITTQANEVVNVPAGIAFSLTPRQIWQLSIGSNDIVSWIRQDRPTISLNLSLLRFHFR